MTTDANPARSELDEALVVDYLAKHPDFFANRNNLLLQMNLPHHQGGAISLVEKQVSLLRERNLENRRKLDAYVETARANDEIFSQCKQLVLALIDAGDADAFFTALERSFREDFNCSAYSLIALNDNAQQFNHFTTAVPAQAARGVCWRLDEKSKSHPRRLTPEGTGLPLSAPE